MLFPLESASLIGTVPSWRSLLLSTVNAETSARTSSFKRADDTGPDDSAAQQAAHLTLKALCCLEGVSPPRTDSAALVQAREWPASTAQLGKLKAKWDALETKQDASRKALSVSAEALHETIEALSRQQHELAAWYIQVAGWLSSTVSAPTVHRVARGPSGTDEAHLPPFKRPRPS